MIDIVELRWIILLPLIIGIFRYKYFTRAIKFLYLFILYGTFNEILGEVLIHVFHPENTMPRSHIYISVSFFALSFYFINAFDKYEQRKKYYPAIATVLIFFIINSLFIEGIWSFASLSFSIHALIMMCLSILFFHKVMLESKLKKMAGNPMIWINSALLFYYTGSLFFYILFNINLDTSVSFTKLTIKYFLISNAIFYGMLAIAFLKTKPEHRTE